MGHTTVHPCLSYVDLSPTLGPAICSNQFRAISAATETGYARYALSNGSVLYSLEKENGSVLLTACHILESVFHFLAKTQHTRGPEQSSQAGNKTKPRSSRASLLSPCPLLQFGGFCSPVSLAIYKASILQLHSETTD